MKFIHTADVHLDSPLRGLRSYEGVAIQRIRTATRDAFVNLVDFAIAQSVDMVVIAGDLYDGDWKDHNTGLFFTSQLVRLRDAGVSTFIISGNHDAANRMTRSLRLPENPDGSYPLLSHESPQTVVLPDLGVAIHGRGFGERAEFDNLVDSYPLSVPGLLNIGMLHTSLAGADGHEPYAPCSVEQLCAKGYQYWALGHVHNRAVYPQDRQSGDPWVVFSGNLQGRHIRETGAKGCLLVEADGVRVKSVEFHAMDVVRWAHLVVPMAEIEDARQLEMTIRQLIQTAVSEAQDRLLAVRVTLKGETSLHEELAAHGERWSNQVRSLALEAGGDNVWIESVALRTTARRTAVVADGPLQEISGYLHDLKSDNRAMAEIMEGFSGLRRKLPEQLTNSEQLRALYDVEAMRELLREVEPLLVGQLKEDDK